MQKKNLIGIVAATAVALSPLTFTHANAAPSAATATSAAAFGGIDALVKAAQKEGTLNVTTLPRDWANYGEAIDLFTKAFGIKINDDNPDGSSAYEITSIKTVKDPKKQPDVVDIGASHLADEIGRAHV